MFRVIFESAAGMRSEVSVRAADRQDACLRAGVLVGGDKIVGVQG